VLSAIGAIEEGGGTPMIEALNKIDALPVEQRRILQARTAVGPERDRQFPVSALSGEGIEQLLQAIEDSSARTRRRARSRCLSATAPPSPGSIATAMCAAAMTTATWPISRWRSTPPPPPSSSAGWRVDTRRVRFL
jgi:50S ribosomal subunit-associated GTPase HflX